MRSRKMVVVGAAISLVIGVVCIFLGFGPLAYEPTIGLSFAVQLAGGILTAFGLGLAMSGTELRRAVVIGVMGSLAFSTMVGFQIMKNENRARRVLAVFGIDLPPQTHEVQSGN